MFVDIACCELIFTRAVIQQGFVFRNQSLFLRTQRERLIHHGSLL
ncbi:Uncharacterised protein [Vibrio cholerae]|nr:Uncharacterised protein [Vibrio cholerae]CSA84420.1 Uncharacterised protein [Vibrio cholerae]CSA89525.1 Uncharacterised protein [Vibrio cholerae]CSB56085.1 Uncharacterised protein [Vibrio cholerae]CSB75522.1 Uncharacterised protein [Vibrio cholerae]